MGLVYKNGLCNIAAAAAKDGSEGCFSQKDPAFFGTMTVRSISARSPPEDYLVVGPHCTEHLGRYDQPLYSRGWVIQEWFLATRVLHFGRTMIFWECQRGIASEASPALDEPERAVVGHLPKTAPQTSGTPFNDLMFYWSDLVVLYAQAGFTRKEDKLPAFSGIAKEVGERLRRAAPRRVEYLAGLWSRCLAQQLLWSAFWVGDEARRPECGRPEVYRAPSWSWASTDYHVMPPRCREGAEKNVLVEIVDYDISSVSDDAYLQVKAGHLRIRCWLWRLNEQERNGYANTSPSTHPNGFEGENGTFSYDEATSLPAASGQKALDNHSKASVFLMPVIQGAYRFEEHPAESSKGKAEVLLRGLILEKVPNSPGQFQRIGTFSMKKIWVELQEDISPSLVLTDCDLRPSMHHILQQVDEQLLVHKVHGPDSGDYEERCIDPRFGAQGKDHLSKYLYTITIV
ncbi:hypothetical protein GTA08_BOTSDO06099 [Neofusicoccum parvum]|uniref:Uncharacterized protein n=1 Tax=Neofusicoccum parvum TaxID=310453 RepID=A0ACB5SMX3_9PEZI|nr:hypothetical protein GTA08_BOTSDO06099 [Neofusicoccum parvum]